MASRVTAKHFTIIVLLCCAVFVMFSHNAGTTGLTNTNIPLVDKLHNQLSNFKSFSATNVPERQLLPKNVKPVNYDLKLTPNFETFKFDGNLDLTYVFAFFGIIYFDLISNNILVLMSMKLLQQLPSTL